MTKITEKFLNKFPRGTEISINTDINGKIENIDALLKNDNKYWISIYKGRAMTVPNLVKYIALFTNEKNMTVKINPNLHSDGDEPIYIFSEGDNWTINNTKFLGARKTSPSRKTYKSLPNFTVGFRKML